MPKLFKNRNVKKEQNSPKPIYSPCLEDGEH